MKYTFEKNIIMDALQRIYYAIGLLAYSVAKADGEIQKEEKERLQNILLEEFKNGYADTDISEIIFEILRKDKQNYETAYNWAINELKVCSHKLTPEIKLHLLAVWLPSAEESTATSGQPWAPTRSLPTPPQRQCPAHHR